MLARFVAPVGDALFRVTVVLPVPVLRKPVLSALI